MFLIREVFRAKPGKAKELVRLFKSMTEDMAGSGIKNTRILTDAASDYWTVIVESEVEDLNAYIDMSHDVSATSKETTNKENKVSENMTDYRDLVNGGYREIFRIED